MKNKYAFIFLLLISILIFSGVACSKSSSNSTPPTPYGGGGATLSGISMYNMAFSPASKTVSIGTVVKWTNNDAFAHTVTSNDGTSFNSGNVNGGATYSYTASVAGTFTYHCTIHGVAMSGTLIVTP